MTKPVHRRTFALARPKGRSRFEIYRADQIPLTSTLFGGGDWHWRLTDLSGTILADAGGCRNRGNCLAVVEALRAEAGSAFVTECPTTGDRAAQENEEIVYDC